MSKAQHILLGRNRRAAWVRAVLPLLAGLRKSKALPPASERGEVKLLVNIASQRRASVQGSKEGRQSVSRLHLHTSGAVFSHSNIHR